MVRHVERIVSRRDVTSQVEFWAFLNCKNSWVLSFFFFFQIYWNAYWEWNLEKWTTLNRTAVNRWNLNRNTNGNRWTEADMRGWNHTFWRRGLRQLIRMILLRPVLLTLPVDKSPRIVNPYAVVDVRLTANSWRCKYAGPRGQLRLRSYDLTVY